MICWSHFWQGDVSLSVRQDKGPAGAETFEGALVKVLQGLTEMIAPAKKKVSLQPLDMVLKKTRKAILRGEFFEISWSIWPN